MAKRPPEQTLAEFLAECGIRANSLKAMLALHMREVLAIYALHDTGIRKARHVFANHRIEGDLRIGHMDSLNLVDVILEFEKKGICIDQEDAMRLFGLNERDATVAEIVREFIEIIEDKSAKAPDP